MSNREAEEFFKVGGTLDPDAPSYVPRPADEELQQAVQASRYCNVLAARQVGKSSLMTRTKVYLEARGTRTAVIDLSEIGTPESASEWYLGVLSRLKRELRLDLDEFAWWNERDQLGPPQRFSDFIRDVALEEIQAPIVVFIDEIDTTLNLAYTDDFFTNIRYAYNKRASDPAYKRLTFVLLGVARPANLIKNPKLTSYNIGTSIDLGDFTAAKAREVLLTGLRIAYPDQAEEILEYVLHWTGGHPYLTQKICYEVVAEHGRWTKKQIDQLVERLFFSAEVLIKETNLEFIRDRIEQSGAREEILRVYSQILAGKKVKDDDDLALAKTELKLTGLVKRTAEGDLVVRNRIYEETFGKAWLKKNMPVSSTPKPSRRLAIAALAVAVLGILISVYLLIRAENEIRAEIYTSGFQKAPSVELRINNLANLFKLGDEYKDEARNLFFELKTDDQLDMFRKLSGLQAYGSDVLAVVGGVYQDPRLQDNPQSNDLLRQMAEVLDKAEKTDGAGVTAEEIDFWAQGREAAVKDNFSTAVISYNQALKINPDNPAILFDRGTAYVALGQKDDAVKDLQQAVELDNSFGLGQTRADIARPTLIALLATPTPTPTATPTETPALPTPTALPVLPTASPTPTPIVTPTSMSTPQIAYVKSNENFNSWRQSQSVMGISGLPTDFTAAPAWSPDGRQIAFVGKPGIGQAGGIYQQNEGIYLADVENGVTQNEHRLFPPEEGAPEDVESHIKNIAWSPVGNRIAFEVDPDDDREKENSVIWIIDSVGGRQISNPFPGQQPAWSPDGEKLVIKTCVHGCGLRQVNLQGEEEEPLTFEGNDSYPAWSPDGKMIAFTRKVGGNWEIYLLLLDNDQTKNLTNRPKTDVTPIFSPDGQRIYLRTDYYNGWRITSINLNGEDEHIILEEIGRSEDWGLGRPAIR